MTTYWWDHEGVRPVWVEITRRPNDDIGVDLNHSRESRNAYRLLGEPRPGDAVLHWDSKRQQFVGASAVKSPPRDQGARRWIELKQFIGFPHDSVTLNFIRRHGTKIGAIRENGGDPRTHYPFAPYGDAGWRKVRPVLAYLTAAPTELISLLGGIYESSRNNDSTWPSWRDLGLGQPNKVKPLKPVDTPGFLRYLTANEDIDVSSGGISRLPNVHALEAAYREHNRLQNRLASWLKEQGITPESQRAMDRYPVDIQWRHREKVYIGEVKSLSGSNEMQQMRRALGQVLHYRHLAERQLKGTEVQAVIVVPRSPGPDWVETCKKAGVTVVWPETFTHLVKSRKEA